MSTAPRPLIGVRDRILAIGARPSDLPDPRLRKQELVLTRTSS